MFNTLSCGEVVKGSGLFVRGRDGIVHVFVVLLLLLVVVMGWW